MASLPRVDHTYPHRVRFRECDPMGVVYHAHYIDWFEAARTEALRSTGSSYLELMESGIDMPVLDLGASYRKSVMYDDLVDIDVMWTLNDSQTRVRFDYAVRRHGHEDIMVTGHVTLCFVDRDRGRPVRAPRLLTDILAAS